MGGPPGEASGAREAQIASGVPRGSPRLAPGLALASAGRRGPPLLPRPGLQGCHLEGSTQAGPESQRVIYNGWYGDP